MTATLEVAGLRVAYTSLRGPVAAVEGVDFTVGHERVALVGESGSGKSTVGRAVLRLLPASAHVTAERMTFDGIDLLDCDERSMRRVRGGRIGMILQDPRHALNPVMTVGRQIVESYRAHGGIGGREARRRALEMLASVRIRDPERVFAAYPHQLSGGMGQRAMIAMVLAAGPDLLIADEPTSALDVTVRHSVLGILDDLVIARGMGLLIITHDLNLVATFCDRALVMREGRIVEALPASGLGEARHPYTRALLAAAPAL